MQIQIRINEEGALRNLRYAFTDRFTLLSELLQNARRAGASRVRVDYDSTTCVLRVCDNGCGIGDFQKLLTLHESGWQLDTERHESPFGIGFSKCLYAASRCIVRSGDQFVDFRTAGALELKPIEVHLDPRGPIHATEIELHDVDLRGLDDRINHLCEGFPIEVICNGRSIDRPFAMDQIESVPTPIGDMQLAGAHTGFFASKVVAFLQGFRVFGLGSYNPNCVNVVHLNPHMFRARLPDRDKLIDEDDQASTIYAELRDQWRVVLKKAKHTLPARLFVDRYFGAMKEFGHCDLINDVDELPQHVCSSIADHSFQTNESEEEGYFLQPQDPPPSRQRIEAGEPILVSLDSLSDSKAGARLYACARRFLVVNTGQLHEGHWCHTQVRRLDSMSIQLEAVGAYTQSHFNGRWISVRVVLCEAVRLHVGDDVVEIADDGVFHQDVLYIPAGESSGKSVRQVSKYTDEMDRFLHDELQADLAALADLIQRLRSADPKATLGSLLRTLHVEKYPILRDKTFRLGMSGDAGACTIELIE